MTINQVIVECAKLDGYDVIDIYLKTLPPYITSRDAIMSLIKKQEARIQLLIIKELRNILLKSEGCGTKEASLAVLLATPIQLCEALLKATKKW